MKLTFYKYQGTGNDFVMIDNREQKLSKNNTKIIQRLCDRKFGIGADGLILLENPDVEADDFKMVYFNADGYESSMCGNGGRCLVAFAKFLGIVEEKARFTAIDGAHEAVIENGLVSLKMQDVKNVNEFQDFLFLDTGSPHHVVFSEDIATMDIKKEGAAVRYSERYKNGGGTNVNFVKKLSKDSFSVRTYERGVEDETLSCGTGVTAVALAAYVSGKTEANQVKLVTQGGDLSVSFRKEEAHFKDIWLTGPAEFVFKGEIVC
ncbi:diaminopimelate epimerase [Gramella sp. GC03-9]|uniref:Diaminopimelate epimerase n=1 Tax=Christiangramia oceanisediminis TaxID=2920386 RepID=A0A9X2KW07_9FLAO|nr:diaminopimelate epimerase [Gramella oceanisediminis]MCP9199722.1 diaminopimelate epimerase [Gramella oceanisediminis]